MKKVLVTGVNGFVGHHLAKELAAHNISVVGIGGQDKPGSKPKYVDDYLVLDLSDPKASKKIRFENIDAVIHLAGLAAVGPSFDNPLQYIETNIGIEVNLFEAALAQNKFPKFLIISSGGLYDPKASLPITEKSSLLPSSPYAVSKLGQEQMARYYGSRGFEVVIARPFNHIGPGQGLGFIVPDLAQQIVDYKKGLVKEISVGNLEAKRDYTDVRDIARAYRLLIEKGGPGETYNICSGKALSGHQILDGLLKKADCSPKIVQDPARMRPSDNPLIYGSHKKLTSHTGWQPEINIETTLADVITSFET